MWTNRKDLRKINYFIWKSIFLALKPHCFLFKITCNSISRPDQTPNHIIMLSIKLKWPRVASCIPNSTLQPISDQSAWWTGRSPISHIELPISDHRTWSTLVKLYRQVADLFLIQNENIIVLLYSNASRMVSFGYFNME